MWIVIEEAAGVGVATTAKPRIILVFEYSSKFLSLLSKEMI